MRLADITCGACQSTYAAVDGCEVCKPAKDALVLPENDTAIDAFSLSKQGAKIIGLLLDRLEHDIKKRDMKTYYPQWGKDASLLSRALATLLNEIRKFEIAGATEASKLSFDDKRALFLQWVESLPPEHKVQLLSSATQMLRQLPGVSDAEIVQ